MDWRKCTGWDTHIKPFLYKKLPSQTGWSAVFGTLCAIMFIIMAVTGMVLAFYYVPDPDKAYDSVKFISNEVALGNIIRGLHHWGAGAMVLLAFVHLIISYLHGAYQNPRQLTWITGACMFIIVLGLGFTGYLLPWDMKAYWATMVGASIPNQYPGIGNFIMRMILGGNEISGFTLTRFYSVHTLILPACLAVFMVMHIYLIRIHNLSDPRERIAGEKLPEDTGEPFRFFPDQISRAVIAFGVLFVVLLLLATFVDPPIEERAGTFIADYLPRPEWYYMWLFQILTYFSGEWEMIGSIVLFGGAFVALFGVPFFSESKLKGMINRPVSIAVASTLVACIVFLTFMAYHEAKPYNKTIVTADRTLNADQKAGMLLYVEKDCSYCHNILGEGGHRTGPDMSNMARKKRDVPYLANYIRDPKSQMASTTMPEYAMPDAELKQLAEFLLTLDFKKGVKAKSLDTAPLLEEIRQLRANPEVDNANSLK